MDENKLSWIHFSDLHMEPEDRFNRTIVLEALWRDLEGFMARGLQPDFIAFTGDVAYHGAAREYELAIQEFFDPLLARISVPKDRLFIVPGNHDVNRKRTAMLRNPAGSLRTEDDIRKTLENADERDLLLTPFSHYKAFVDGYLSTDKKVERSLLGYSETVKKGGLRIAVVGLNSAWLSGFWRDPDGNVDDYGRLALGELQVRGALAAADLTIVLMHHPFEYLMEEDRTCVEAILGRESAVVLRGHVHRPDIFAVSGLSGNLVVLPSGAVFDTRKTPNAYNIVQVDLSTGQGTLMLRRYNDRRTEWCRDAESTGDNQDGQVAFKLPGAWNTVLQTEIPNAGGNVRAYDCSFTAVCKQDLSSLGLTEDALIQLVQGEFQSHLNYFRFDLEDYPLPVRTGYIVYLSKVQRRIEFMRVIPCSRNEAELASWNDILALYRKATRLAYREDPMQLRFRKGMVGRVNSLHLDLASRIQKHFERFAGLVVHPGLRVFAKEFAEKGRQPVKVGTFLSQDDVPADPEREKTTGDEISFHIGESRAAMREAEDLVKAIEDGDMREEDGLGLIVVAFERSLQHIHKILLRYPPGLEPGKTS